MLPCMWRRFHKALRRLRPDPRLNSSALVRARMLEAAVPNTGPRARYTFVPAAVGVADGWIRVTGSPEQMIRGGAYAGGAESDHSAGRAAAVHTVRQVDVVQWMWSFLRLSDAVLLKIDVEGAEHDVLRTMHRAGVLRLVDWLQWECHEPPSSYPRRPVCDRLAALLRSHRHLTLVKETTGFDSMSDPTRAGAAVTAADPNNCTSANRPRAPQQRAAPTAAPRRPAARAAAPRA